MRIHVINTATDLENVKTFEFLPALQLAWWSGGLSVGIFFLNFGIQISFGKNFNQ